MTELERWLLTAPYVDDGGISLMTGLVERLRQGGLPLWRVSFSLMTKHPELVWHTVQWQEATGARRIDRQRRTLEDPFFTRSPLPRLQAREATAFRVRLAGSGPLDFPICEDLRAQGGSDYYVQALPFANLQVGYISWATAAEGGFSDAWLATLAELTPVLAQRVELESAYHATLALLEVYLGRNAGRRVWRGEFQRGGGELIEAAIWFCDLRDFTRFSDENAPATVVATLNDFFERVAGAVMARGGEVLKFIGDAILAIFPLADDAGAACRAARAAADDALAQLAELDAARGPSAPPLRIGVALHVGPLLYGNVGARDRLDFTVISAAVNETCRLESLCKPLGISLAMSEAFVNAAGADDVVDLGPQTLKGVRAPLRVFGRRPASS